MNKQRPFISVTVTPKAERSLRLGHPWVFCDEIISVSGGYENGRLVDVLSDKGRYLGTGFINDNSKIRVRVISTNTNDKFNAAFFERRLRYAIDYRRAVIGDDFACCRLVFGEADGLPGLTIDRFENVLAVQSLCLGIDMLKPMLIEAVVRMLREGGEQIDMVYERSDVPAREHEGLAQHKGFIDLPGTGLELKTDGSGHVKITENELCFDVDYINGQKTGYFLDQKHNRAAAAKYAAGRRVLDCFTHTGSFALCCSAGGAKSVHAADVSKDAIAAAGANAALNGMQERVSFVQADVFDMLTDMTGRAGRIKQTRATGSVNQTKAAGRTTQTHTPGSGSSISLPVDGFDYIILDPPAFTKSRSTLKNALRGYKQLNFMAMKLLPRGGFLATCSCSHFVTEELFRGVLREAAFEAAVSLRQIEARHQPPDHPVLWNVPETDYLKFYIFQVV